MSTSVIHKEVIKELSSLEALGLSVRYLGTFYQKFCTAFERFLPIVVMLSFIIGIFISGIPGVANRVYVGMDNFIEFYGYIAPIVIFIILAPSLSRMANAKKQNGKDFISFAISWLSFRRFLSLIWAVIFTWIVFDLPLFNDGGTQNIINSLKITGKNMVHMCLTSTYFYAMYLAVASVFIAKRYRKFEQFMCNLLRGVERTGQYSVPFIPVFMLAIGVFVAQLDTFLSDQIIDGYGGKIENLEVVIDADTFENEFVDFGDSRERTVSETLTLKPLSLLGWRISTSGKYSMIIIYVMISLVIGIACMIWHLGLLTITRLKVKGFSIKEYFTNYWIRVYPLLWATSSEALATPLNLYLVKRYYPNVHSKVRHFTIGVGSYLSINGTMICVIVLAGAVANILGIEFSAFQLFLAIPLVFLIGFGVPGIPGELLLFAGPLLQLWNLPAEVHPVFLSLYLGLQIGLPDSFRTGNNSTDDCVMSILLNEEYKRKYFNEGVFIDDLLENVSFRHLFVSQLVDKLSPQPAIHTDKQSFIQDCSLFIPQKDKRKVVKEQRKFRSLYRRAEDLAALHAVLSSSRGDFYRLRLLQFLESDRSMAELESQRANNDVKELHRHLNMLQKFSLIKEVGSNGSLVYRRTELGEKGVNALRALGRRVDEDGLLKILQANFGVNSIHLFLNAYGYKKDVDFQKPEFEFTPLEIGQITMAIPRTVEGVSAIEKLGSAEILVYSNDGNIRMNAQKARALFQYLVDINTIYSKVRSAQLIVKDSFKLNPADSQYTMSHN